MLLSVNITEKSFGAKILFSRVNFSVDDGEKIGVIGRNGIGKSTIFNILSGKDTDFTGDIIRRRGTVMVATSQEYHDAGDSTTVEYILSGLPDFARFSEIIRKFPELENPKKHQIEEYSDALEQFSDKGYYHIEDQVREELKAFQLADQADMPFSKLSGGQKRLSEVIKIMYSNAHIALVDEPTNFMDYATKAQFIDWMKSSQEAVLIITHDRDVLREVGRIIEIKDGTAVSYPGNYEAYLAQNSNRTVTNMNEYEIVQRRIENLRKQISYARSKKASWGGTADKKNPFVVIEERCKREIQKLEQTERPSFWIDRGSVTNLDYKDSARYEKYKARNLKLQLKTDDTKSKKILVSGRELSVGYETPLFADVNFEVREGESVEIRGRNGAGKTTLIKALLDAKGPQLFAGEKHLDPHARIGIYQQEVDTKYFDLKLPDAVAKIYSDLDISITDTKIRQILANYLFTEPDREVLVRNLSGGQKARLQIISMLANEPNLLVLDEPTSHLDLPSIEELEQALLRYNGAIIYISHDNYFRQKLGGQIVAL